MIYQDQDGYQKKKKKKMTSIIKFETNSGIKRRCDSRCHHAKGQICACICQGNYHGANNNGTLAEKVAESQETLLRDLQSRGKVIFAQLPLPTRPRWLPIGG